MMQHERLRNRIVDRADIPPQQLIPHPLAWRRHGRDQRDHLAIVVDRVGWVDEVIVNRGTGHVLNGHLRLELAVLRCEPTVPVSFVDLDEAEERFVLATFDPLADLVMIDEDARQHLLASLDEPSTEIRQLLEAPQRQDGTLPRVDADPDDLPAVPRPWAKRGDRIVLGDHALLCGDSTSALDVDRLLGDARISWIWTDPPYGNEYVGAGRRHLTIANNHADDVRPLLRAAFARANEHLAPAVPVYVAHPAGALGIVFGEEFEAAGWHLHQALVWVKDSLVLGHSDYHYRHEPILYGWAGKRPTWHGGRDNASVFEVPRPRRSREHPTQKPVQLIETHLRCSTRRDELGYDPFAGSGSTLIAAERLGRRCFAMELEPAYVDAIVARWERYTGRRAEWQ